MNDLRPLASAECLALLSASRLGHLGFCQKALPSIRPVNFAMYAGDIVVRTRRGSTISALDNNVVAFEVDDIDQDTGTGWSVMAIGKAAAVTDIDELVALSDPHHRSWVTGDLGYFLRIPIEIITGRRLALHAVQ